MSAVFFFLLFFSVPASFAFIYLAAFLFARKDCMFGDRLYRDASRNVSQQGVFFPGSQRPESTEDPLLPCLYF